MQDDTTQTPADNTPADAPTDVQPDEPKVDAEPATPAEAPSEQPTEQGEQPDEGSEEVNLDEFWRERYKPVPSQGQSPNTVDDIARELASLPADETGTVDGQSAAKWFAAKLDQVSNRANQSAVQRAEQAAMAVVTETSQQQQLLKKYPDLTRDREMLDAIFDLRDAAALRGQTLSLTDAADKLDKMRQSAAKGARRQTTVQAATHLETAAHRGDNNEASRDMTERALHGSGQQAKEARQAILKSFVEKEIAEGRIQVP